MKTKIKIFFFSISILIHFVIKAQNNGTRIMLKASLNRQEVRFYVYKPSIKAKIIYKDTIQAVNKYPEQLMSSIISERNKFWYYYNHLKKRKISKELQKRFDKVKSLNKEKNYFELLHKLTYTQNGQKYAIIKFKLILEEKEKPIKGAYTLVFDNGRWKKTSSSLETILHIFFKTDKLQMIIKGEKTVDSLVNSVISKVLENGQIDLEKLQIEFENWSKNNNIEYLNYFTEQPNWN